MMMMTMTTTRRDDHHRAFFVLLRSSSSIFFWGAMMLLLLVALDDHPLLLPPRLGKVRAMAIEAECSACRSVARELARKLLQEDDSKRTLNLHYGLKDSKGNRQGKTLDYFASEERAYDILETTCDGLKEYALGKGENRALQWLQMDGDKQTRQKMLVSFAGEPNQENAEKRGLGGDWKDRWKSEGKKLVQWCQLFLEDQEELLLKLLKEKVVTKETARDGILVDLMCKEENALQTFERPPPCSDKADSAIDLPIDATTTPSTRPNQKSTQRNDL